MKISFFTLLAIIVVFNYLLAQKSETKSTIKVSMVGALVGWVQNIGGSPEPASYDSWQNYGTGAFLLAGSEVLKLVD